MREFKFRAWDECQNRMINKTFWDRDWYTSDDKCLCGLMPEDRHSLKLMQYTGLKDKNGVEIYEGDYLQNSNGFGGHMFWDERQSGWSRFLPLSEFEVIGNIYENPELLDE